MAHQISHVIEYRAHHMLSAIGAVYAANPGWQEERDQIARIEAAAGYKQGWYFDVMADAIFQNVGGRGIVWAEQPVMD